MANESIFKFGDKFGYESPFGNWLKKEEEDNANLKTYNEGINLAQDEREDENNEQQDKDIQVLHIIRKGDTYSDIVKIV